jgi:hypothetical protein
MKNLIISRNVVQYFNDILKRVIVSRMNISIIHQTVALEITSTKVYTNSLKIKAKAIEECDREHSILVAVCEKLMGRNELNAEDLKILVDRHMTLKIEQLLKEDDHLHTLVY